MLLLNPFAFADNFGDGSQTIPAVVYDGVQGYLKHTGGPTGAADGAALTVVWAGTFNSDGSAMTLLDIPGTVPVKLSRTATNTIQFQGGTAGAVFSNVTAAVAASLGFLIILASCNGTASTLKVVHAAGTITGTNTAGAAATLDLTADWFLGADGGTTEFLDADTAMWWIDDQNIDFTDADNIEQFWDTTNDLLRDPGATGSNPLDGASSPLVCHKSAAASHVTNSGTGGDADTAGTFTDGASPGTYATDFVPATASIPAVVYNGAYLGVHGLHASDVRYGIISFWFRKTTNGTQQRIIADNNDRVDLRFGTDNVLKLALISNGASSIFGGFNSPTAITAAITDTNWHHIIISWDSLAITTGSIECFLDGVDQSLGNGALDANVDLNRGSYIGADTDGSESFSGEMAQIYMNFSHTSYFDLTVEANREKFYDSANAKPRDLDLDGTGVGLPQPDTFLNTAAASYGTNAGTAGDWPVNGTFTDAAAGPGAASPQP